MPRKHSSRSVARQHFELAWASPQVIAHRTARMMAAGARPGARDAAEFTRMFTEKTSAFTQAWIAMGTAMYWAPWRAFLELLGAAPGPSSLWRAWSGQAWRIAGSGLAPVHRTAVANSRRLARR